MPLTFKVTTAGRAALVNAGNTGTLPVTVTQVGVTATAFTAAADGSDLALPGELKRLATFGGAAVADDTIHAVIRDDSADVYTLRGFALYLADGTLFGLYGQADAILEKSAAAMMLLASDIIFADIDAASLVFGDTSFLNPPATVDTAGVVKLATDAKAIDGIDGTCAVTPKGLLAKLNALLGAGNPSAFVKSLLDKASALAFVTALGIRGAASYDTGTGNGLDADLLDGQHGAYYRAWGSLTGVPATFTPSAHQHSAADIISGLLAVARGGTGAGTFAAGSYLIGNGTSAFAVKTPAQVLADIGAAPVAHSHAIANVNGLPDALDGLLAAIATKQPNLGFTPVQQGTGVGQNTNTVKIGWASGSGGLLATVDATDLGQFVFWGSSPSFGVVTATGNNFIGGPAAAVLAPSGSGSCQLRPNGPASSVGALVVGASGNISVSGGITCLTVNATGSDIRIKTNVQPVEPRPLHRLMAATQFGAIASYTHLADGVERRGPIAQDVDAVDSSFAGTFDVEEGEFEHIPAGVYLSVDKASMAYEQAMWAGAEIDHLQNIISVLQERLSLLESR